MRETKPGGNMDSDLSADQFEPDGITPEELFAMRDKSEITIISNDCKKQGELPHNNKTTPQITNNQSWKNRANCRDYPKALDIFYSNEKRKKEQAKEICAACPVRHVCLSFALENEIKYGIWGGVEEGEIRKLITERKKQKKAKSQKV